LLQLTRGRGTGEEMFEVIHGPMERQDNHWRLRYGCHILSNPTLLTCGWHGRVGGGALYSSWCNGDPKSEGVSRIVSYKFLELY